MKTPRRVSRTRRLIHRHSILVSHGLIALVAALDIAFDRSSSAAARISLSLFLAMIVLLGIARYVNFLKINSRPTLHISLYYILIASGLILFARIGSTYAYAWLIILFLTYFYYGLRATLGSLLLFAGSLELQLLFFNFRTDAGISRNMALSALIQFGIIAAMAMFFVDTESASEHDQKILRNNMEKVQLEHERIISLINSMTDGVIATDSEGVVTLYNAGALNILDTNQDLTGKVLRGTFRVFDAAGKRVNVLGLVGEKQSTFSSRDLVFKYPDGEKINLSLTVSQIKVGFRREDEKGYIITFRDITREKSLEEERDEFISVISHELRTPVAITEANISNAMFVAEKTKDIDVIQKSLVAAHDQSLFLANMLNDLSTLSRAERGKLDLNPEEINPRHMAEALLADYQKQAESKGLSLVCEVADSVPETIISNGLYVREILQNFITNAVKYTKEGTVTICVEPAGNGVRFTIRDTGIGISKSDLKKVFDKFFRSEDYRTRESNGTGLGLYITKKLAKIIGASFEIESKLNEGSSFGIVVPDLKDQLPK